MSSSAVPPPPSLPAVPPRDMSLPPQPGEDVGMFNVVSCTPDRLDLKVTAGFILFVLVGCGIAVLWAMFNLWTLSGYAHQYGWRGKYWGIIVVAVFFAVLALMNLGRRMQIDRQKVRVTWAFLLTTEHAAHQFKSVNLEIVKPSSHVAPPQPAEGSTEPSLPIANTAVLTLAGASRVKIGEAALSTPQHWPSLAATAAHLSRILRIPLVVEGSPELASPPHRLLITQIQAQAHAG